jgi:peptidoglycan-associated lipoprotein
MSGSGAGAGAGGGAGALAPVPANLQQGNVIRFAFDSFEIPSEYLTLVDAHARFLSANPRRKVMLAGHADEQGGREYNLALGQKRAEAVRQRLTFLGVPDRQIEAVSFGEEKPVATGGGEDAYRQNRRAEISYP